MRRSNLEFRMTRFGTRTCWSEWKCDFWQGLIEILASVYRILVLVGVDIFNAHEVSYSQKTWFTRLAFLSLQWQKISFAYARERWIASKGIDLLMEKLACARSDGVFLTSNVTFYCSFIELDFRFPVGFQCYNIQYVEQSSFFSGRWCASCSCSPRCLSTLRWITRTGALRGWTRKPAADGSRTPPSDKCTTVAGNSPAPRSRSSQHGRCTFKTRWDSVNASLTRTRPMTTNQNEFKKLSFWANMSYSNRTSI